MNARPPMPQSLPAALHGFTAFNQWLNYRLTPQPSGKLKKEAVGRGGYRVDPTNPAEWMSYDEAAATGKPLAFSFSESDPFFFLDIDNALSEDGVWSDNARKLCASMAGCAIEISSSGRGLHVFGIGGAALLVHSNRRDDLGLEFYTRGRFVALTGNMLTPDGSVFHSPPELPALVAEYFPPSQHTAATDWTDGPCDGWAGPTDDDELVRRASRHVSAAAAFAGKATFADLWSGNAEALANAYPSSTSVYDGSSADAALCAHLAWWTGKDCERMARLLRASGLARDKHDREDYVQRTILRACGLVTDVLQDRPAAVLPPPRPPAPIAVSQAREAMPELVESVGFMRPEQAAQLFKGCVYVRDLDRVWMPNGEMLKPAAFNVFFGGFQFVLDDVGKKTTDEAFKALTRNPMLRCPQVAASTFDPKLEPGTIVTDFKGRDAVNTWLPPAVRVVSDGDVTPFLTHLGKVLPDERDRAILLSWMAALVQHPGHKFTWAPVLQGVEGNGKSFFAVCCSEAVSPRYSHTPRNKDLIKDFNSWMHRKLFAVVDEARVDTPEMIESLRNLITEETQTIEPKGVDADSHRVFVNFMFTMNDKRAMKKTRNDRRLAMFYTAQQHESDLARDGMDGDYMQNLYDWAKGQHAFKHLGVGYGFAVIAHYLRTYTIPDEFNPIGAAHRAPRTSAHEEAVGSSLGPREQEVQELIDTWAVGFRDGWVSSHYGLEALRKRDSRVRVSGLDEVLGNVGYVRHPGLKDGRVHNAVNGEGRIVLYVAKGRMDLLALEGGEIAKAYTEAQSRV